MKKIKVAINGAGRIGRAFLRVAHERKDVEVVAINDLGNIDNIAYLLKYDTAYGVTPFDIGVSEDKKSIVVDGKNIAYFSEKDPSALPWGVLKIDVVVESTGFFAAFETARVHITAGAKRVVISAPAKDEAGADSATILMGINEEKFATSVVTSNASCTTNSVSPLIAILHEAIGIEKAMLNTVHAYTASQGIVDGPNKKDFREGRAAAQNIVPSSTGAAIAVTKAFPELIGRFDGIAMRVPVVVGSIADITFIAKRDTTAQEVNEILKKAAGEARWANIFSVTKESLVSSDIKGSKFASIADLSFTRVVGGNLVKVLAWYDNEMGYTYTLVDHVVKAGNFI
ncbi:type I glyceraldehyde-3-phosphate dehydrogenase [Candidatus Parcubacteria bacterium]|nr:type I glyceraldehyde-3-phosphate dehydrogenase [Candidatus Parcubacteria bacterium]